MKQGQPDIVGRADVQQGLLGPVLGPGRGQHAGILGRVGVANHYHHVAAQLAAVPIVLQQGIHHLPGPGQVIQGFEQGCHRQVVTAARLLQQQVHGQYVRGLPRHGYHVGPQRLAGLGGDHGAGVQHFAHFAGGLPVRGHQRSASGELPQQEGAPGRLVPGGVIPQAEIGSKFRQRLGVAGAVLAHIVAQQVHAETAHPAQQIQQRAIGDNLHAAFMQ